MLYALWCAAIVVKGAAACRMVVTGIARLLPLVCCYVICMALDLTVLLALYSFPRLYMIVYSAGLPFLFATECAAAASIFWALTGSYKNFRVAGTVILCALTAAGSAAAWAISFLTSPVRAESNFHWLWFVAFALQRYTAIITAIVLLGILLLHPRSSEISVPRFAVHAAWVMIVDAFLRFLSSLFMRLYAYPRPMLSACLTLTSGILAGFAWLTLRTYDQVTSNERRSDEPLAPSGRLVFEAQSVRSAVQDFARLFTRER
jgi:hypothetical protein